jgi:predicted dehydrogenase/threonine dehydrogenase-like Zn-dependent dehydrogenase
MKQVVQNYKTGHLALTEVPAPGLAPGRLVVRTAFSAVSLGTEGKKVATARKTLVGKARSRPDLVQQVIRSARRDGLATTYQRVANRLDEPITLGYSAAGVVVGLGPGVTGFAVGDRVACGGEGAAHAEFLSVPVNLCAQVPAAVSLRHAAFTTIASIAMQGVRQSGAALGDAVVVIGLGLVGQLTVQLLCAQGCRVVGVDLDDRKLAAALVGGAESAYSRRAEGLEAAVAHVSGGFGADCAIVTAGGSGTDAAELAVAVLRDRGRLVVVGGIPLEFPREDAYRKELDIRMSRSYGAGRYDPLYEEAGIDYPVGYVPWTEQRNMAECLRLMDAGLLDVEALMTHVLPFADAEGMFAKLAGGGASELMLGVVLDYGADARDPVPAPGDAMAEDRTLEMTEHRAASPRESLSVGFVGAGSFARKSLLPPLVRRGDVFLESVSTSRGVTSEHAARKFGFATATTDWRTVVASSKVEAVFVATRHDLHADAVVACLEAGKSVFVEKPLATTPEQLARVTVAYSDRVRTGARNPQVMVGFNRRFAPHGARMREVFAGRVEPMLLTFRVNAGFMDGDHWYHHPQQGGGRLIGEGCHFIDFARYVVDSPVAEVEARTLPNGGRYHDDNVSVTLLFADGSLAHVIYLANGSDQLRKEYVEAHSQGVSCVIDDFRCYQAFAGGKKIRDKRAQDKGHTREVGIFVDAARLDRAVPFTFDDYATSTAVTLAAADSVRRRCAMRMDGLAWVPVSRAAGEVDLDEE